MANVEMDIADRILAPSGLGPSRLGLRLDKVVVRVLGGLRAFAEAAAPEGTTVLLTLTAPIRLPAKTVDDLKQEIAAMLASGEGERSPAVHGNAARLRIIGGVPPHAPKLIGFVHNPDSPSDTLLELAEGGVRAWD